MTRHNLKPKAMTLKSKYWEIMDTIKTQTGQYPVNVFDFISIHKNNVHNNGRQHYFLCSPIILVNPQTGERPCWEMASFITKKAAINFAREICESIQIIHIVDCC